MLNLKTCDDSPRIKINLKCTKMYRIFSVSI